MDKLSVKFEEFCCQEDKLVKFGPLYHVIRLVRNSQQTNQIDEVVLLKEIAGRNDD